MSSELTAKVLSDRRGTCWWIDKNMDVFVERTWMYSPRIRQQAPRLSAP